MITAARFVEDLRGPLEIRQEISGVLFEASLGSSVDDVDSYSELQSRMDDVVKDYWTESMLSHAEQIGDTKRRPLNEDDIPVVAASLCIQFLMAGTFPNLRRSHVQNLLDGKRANPVFNESLEIETLELTTIDWLSKALELGRRAETGKPTIVSDSRQILHVTKRPQLQVMTKHKDGAFHETKTSIELGVAMASRRRKGAVLADFDFDYAPQTAATLGTMIPLQNISGPYEKRAKEILAKVNGVSKPISIDELYLLTIAKLTGLVKKQLKEPIKVEFVQNRKLSTQDAKSFKRLKEAANRAGITFCLVHPAPAARI